VGIYANVDTLLAITVGMAVMAREGGYESVTTFGADDAPVRIHNYRIGPLTHTQLQRMQTVDSAQNTIIYIGYHMKFPGETRLCTAVDTCAQLGRHTCGGILGLINDPDIRLAFCLGREIQIQGPDMTVELPDRPAYAEVNKELKAYMEMARQWNNRIAANPETWIPRFHKMADDPITARQAAFIVAASKTLDEALFLHDARKHRQQLSPGNFLNYLYGLPASSRTLVVQTFRDQAASAAPAPQAAAPTEPKVGSGLEGFFASFVTASTDERSVAWRQLSEQDRKKAATNLLVGHWVSHILPVVQKYEQCAASADQPFGWFEAFTYESGLSEEDEAEAKDTKAFRTASEACLGFVHTARPAAKLALWQRFEQRPELLRLLAQSGGDGPNEWKAAPQPSTRADPLAEWVAAYRAPQAAQVRPTQVVVEQQPQPEPESDLESSENYWDDLDTANFLATRRWGSGDTVHVAHEGQRFKFADKTEPAPHSTSWSEFKVADLTFDGAVLMYVSGPVDQEAFAAYLAQLAPRGKVTLRQ
jgi:hypothetical protein